MRERNFGYALELLRSGKKVTRPGWNGKGMWVRKIDLYNDKEFVLVEKENSTGTFMPFNVIFSEGQLHVWNPSIQDLCATDWEMAE